MLNSSKNNRFFYYFMYCQFQIIILKIYNYILIHNKNILLFLFGFNRNLDYGVYLHILNK
jgi:hypothetical protein